MSGLVALAILAFKRWTERRQRARWKEPVGRLEKRPLTRGRWAEGRHYRKEGQVLPFASLQDYRSPMARPLRIEFEGAVYHVTSRGDRREPIFEDDEDRLAFLR